MMTKVRDTITERKVFSEPYVQDGVTVITAATVGGGAGGGSGKDDKGQEGEGAGFGTSGKPVGAYVLKDGQVAWRPAVDVNRLLTHLAVVAVVFLITRARIAKVRAKAELAG